MKIYCVGYKSFCSLVDVDLDSVLMSKKTNLAKQYRCTYHSNEAVTLYSQLSLNVHFELRRTPSGSWPFFSHFTAT